MAEEKIAAAGRITDAETGDGVSVEAAVLEIGAGGFAFESTFELFNEVRLSLAMDFDEHAALLIFATLFRRAFFGAGKRHTTFFGDDTDGFWEGALFHFHNEFEDVAALAAAEAVVNLFGGVDVEGRSFFGVEGAQAAEILASFFQLDVFTDDANDVRLLFDFFRE